MEQEGVVQKRFILFVYESYYPGGGSNDIIGSYDTLEELHAEFAKLRHVDYAEMFDCQELSCELLCNALPTANSGQRSCRLTRGCHFWYPS